MKPTDTEHTTSSNETLDTQSPDVDVTALPTIEFTQEDFDFLTAAQISAETPDAPHASDEEIAVFLRDHNIEPGQNVIANVDGSVRAIDTRIDDFGTSARGLTNELLDKIGTSQEKTDDGPKDYESSDAGTAVADIMVMHPDGDSHEEIVAELTSEARALAESSNDELDDVVVATTESSEQSEAKTKEFDEDDKKFMRSEFDALINQVSELRKQYPSDREGHSIQAMITNRFNYYKTLMDTNRLSGKAFNLLSATMLGASTDIGVAQKEIYSKPDASVELDPAARDGLQGFVSQIDKFVRADPNVHPDVILSIISKLNKEAQEKKDSKSYVQTIKALAGGLATHLKDSQMAHSVAVSNWGKEIGSID